MWNTCFGRGKNACELACGQLRAFLDTAFEAGMRAVLGYCHGLRESEHADIVTSFGQARAELTTTLTLKTAQWDVIPLKACGMMHWDSELATTCANQCLQQFDRIPDDTKHHRVSVEFFSPRGAWRSEVQRLLKTKTCFT